MYAKGRACAQSKVLIIGAGPCGVRAAIECQLLGAKVVGILDCTIPNVMHKNTHSDPYTEKCKAEISIITAYSVCRRQKTDQTSQFMKFDIHNDVYGSIIFLSFSHYLRIYK